jgi:uncharacterized protein YndB with AHSA1/START domain
MSKKKLEFKFERTILATPEEAYDAWLDPKVPGNPWNEADKLILNPEVDGFFYWLIRENPHYGRFTELKKGSRIQNTWMSPSTLGEESMVSITFKKQGENTLMTLVHSDLPDCEAARGHERGWNYFLDGFHKRFESRKKK